MRRQVAFLSVLALLAGLVAFAPATAQAAEAEGAGQVYGGLYSDDQFNADADLDALAAATGKRVTFGGTFHSVVAPEVTGPAVQGQWSNTREILHQVWKGKATPFANLSIPDNAKDIADGDWDWHVNRWLDHLELYLDLPGEPNLILAPLQEMNGDWTPYRCDAENFKKAFRRIVDITRNRGIDETQVRFAFAPNGWSSPSCGSIPEYYPGHNYVDVIGISAYQFSPGTQSVYQVMGGVVADVSGWYPTKPIIIAQTGAWHTSGKAQWIRDMFSWAASNPHVVGVVYFNFNKSWEDGETDWRVWFSPGIDSGWKDGMQAAGTKYQHPLDWFQPGTLTLGPAGGVNLCPKGKDCDTVAFQDSGGRFQIWTHSASAEIDKSFYFGNPGDVAFSGDWDCDGVETLGLYRQSDGYVYLRNSNTQGVADITFYFGIPGDFPIAGDFNNDGCDTVSIYRPSQARFYIINELGSNDGGLGSADYAFYFGVVGDKPFVGDFDKDGVDTVGLHRESNGLVYFRNSNSTGVADSQFIYGIPNDKIVAGDWDGDGDDTVGVYRPSTGMFYLRNSNTAGFADSQAYAGAFTGVVAIDP